MCLVHVAVVALQHPRAAVPHKVRYGDCIRALFQHILGESMPEILEREFLSHMLLKPPEPAGKRLIGPRHAVLVAEQHALRVLLQVAFDNLLGPRRHPDNAGEFLALGLARREDHAMMLQVHMPRLDALGFLRPASCLPTEFQNVAERIALGVVIADFHPFFGADKLLALLRLRLGDFTDRLCVNIAKIGRPIERPLDSDDASSAVGVAPCLAVTIRPFNNVVRLQFGGGKPGCVRLVVDEVLNAIPIPFIRARLAVFLAPRKVVIEHFSDGEAIGGGCFPLRRLGHQFMELSFGFFFIGAEVVALAGDGDVPRLPIFVPPRLRNPGYLQTLQLLP